MFVDCGVVSTQAWLLTPRHLLRRAASCTSLISALARRHCQPPTPHRAAQHFCCSALLPPPARVERCVLPPPSLFHHHYYPTYFSTLPLPHLPSACFLPNARTYLAHSLMGSGYGPDARLNNATTAHAVTPGAPTFASPNIRALGVSLRIRLHCHTRCTHTHRYRYYTCLPATLPLLRCRIPTRHSIYRRVAGLGRPSPDGHADDRCACNGLQLLRVLVGFRGLWRPTLLYLTTALLARSTYATPTPVGVV